MEHGIIIPCYNEAERLNVKEFSRFSESHPNFTLCFVDDGSSDNTLSVLKEIKKSNPEQIHIHDLEQNAGKANAVKQGATYMYKHTSVKSIGFLDADLSTSLLEYEDLVDEMDIDPFLKIVIGSRNKEKNDNIERNLIRNILSKIVRKLTYAITRLPIADTQCGAKVFERDLIPVIFKNDFSSKWLFDVEILLRLKNDMGKSKLLGSFYEKPLKEWIHMDGSKLGFKDSLAIPVNLINIWLEYSFFSKFRISEETLEAPVLRAA